MQKAFHKKIYFLHYEGLVRLLENNSNDPLNVAGNSRVHIYLSTCAWFNPGHDSNDTIANNDRSTDVTYIIRKANNFKLQSYKFRNEPMQVARPANCEHK